MSNQNNTQQLKSNLPPPLVPSKYKKPSHQYTIIKPYYLNNSIKQTSTDTSIPCISQNTSIEEPIPNTNIQNLRIEINEVTYYNIPIGLPNTPSTYHSSNNPLSISTVSADSEIKANEQIHTLDRPRLKLAYNSSSNTSSQKTPVSDDSIHRNKKHTYIPQIIASFPDTNIPFTLSLSPINKQQKQRNKSYDHKQITYTNYLSDSDSEIDENMLNSMDLIMQYTTNNTHHSHNSSNTNNQNQNNNQKNNQNDSNNNNTSNTGSSSGSSSGSGSGGDDEKKDNNDKHIDENDYTETETETEQKQDEEEDNDDEKMELKHVTFSDVIVNKPNKSVSTLSPIEECAILSSSKSAPVPNKSILNRNAAEFVPKTPVNENCVFIDSKSLPIQRKVCKSDCVCGYMPYGLDRAKGCIQLSKKLTQNVIPIAITENIQNVYEFIDKCTTISMYHDNFFDNGQVRIFNYGFDDKLGNNLYCIADNMDVQQNNYRKLRYKMREELFTKNEICDLFNGIINNLPISTRKWNENMINNTMNKIKKELCNPAMFCQKVIFNTKWHKVHIYTGNTNKKQMNKFNTERLTLHFTKTKFIHTITKFIYDNSNNNNKLLIPIVMFSDTKYEIQYIQIVPLRDDVSIGISYAYIHHNKTIKVTGIHLKKMNILNQHQIIVSDHNCQCLNSFISIIDDLHIGNPDDDKNRYKAARKEVSDLKTKNDIVTIENQQLKNENKELKQENSILNDLKNENDILKNYIAQMQNNISNSNSSSLPSMVPSMSSYDTSSSYTSNTPNIPKYTNTNVNINTKWNTNGFVMLQQPTPVETVASMQNNYSNNYSNI